ncbi:Site-specific recombinase XerD (plasmid) [Variovorax sp. RA8]|nr:Site-specific recombinase XerD [Variovorax sp. RA8]
MEATASHREPWNKGKLVGQKTPFRLKEIWAIPVRLQLQSQVRDLALFNLGIDSKLKACDLAYLRVRDVSTGERVAARAKVMQQKIGQPVQFEMTNPTRLSVEAWIDTAQLNPGDFLFPSRVHESPHIGTRQYARIVDGWVEEIGLDSAT